MSPAQSIEKVLKRNHNRFVHGEPVTGFIGVVG